MKTIALITAAAFVVLLLLTRETVKMALVQQSIIDRIATAIAYAEGYFVQGSRASRNRNPGNLKRDITGTGSGYDKDGFVMYRTDADGWNALKKLVRLMFGGSQIYRPSMTIREVAQRYTLTEQDAWAANVASRLNVSTTTKLSDIGGTVA